MNPRSALDLSLYLVTDRELSMGRDLAEIVRRAIAGGVSIVQLREKNCSRSEFIALARKLLQVTRPAGIPLIVNDAPDVAVEAGADGIHIGQNDMPAEQVREIVGKKMIIGLSVENAGQASAANRLPVDYLGISPVYSTPTKTDTAPALGLDGVAAVRAATGLPLVGIGGINNKNAGEIISAGADGIAVVSAICSAAQPQEAASRLHRIVIDALHHRSTGKITST